jgi:phage terminase small subunit
MDWEKIRREYETTIVALKTLAEKHGVKESTMRSRKNREKWQRNDKATQLKNVATKKEPEPIIENDDLTDKQKLFCLYYLKYFNATKAYKKAYECSYKVANVEGYRNLVKPSIKSEIDRLKAERQKGIYIDGMAVLQKYIDIAFADITDFVQFGRKEVPRTNILGEPIINENGEPEVDYYNYVDFTNAGDVDGSLIAEVKQGKDGVSIKLADKMRALEMITKYTELLPEAQKKRLEQEKLKLEIEKIQSGDDDKPIEIMIKRKT